MSLKQQIVDDMKQAMRDGNAAKRDTLRMLDSMVKNVEIEKKKREEGLSDEETREVIAKAIKQRKDSATQFVAGGRPELAESENQEIEILAVYMPAQLGEDQVRAAVKATIVEMGATTKAEMGKVMSAAMGKLKGQADGNLVRKIVEESLQ